jgi:hypothetical protein
MAALDEPHNIGLDQLKRVRSFEFQAILALIRMNAPAGARAGYWRRHRSAGPNDDRRRLRG